MSRAVKPANGRRADDAPRPKGTPPSSWLAVAGASREAPASKPLVDPTTVISPIVRLGTWDDGEILVATSARRTALFGLVELQGSNGQRTAVLVGRAALAKLLGSLRVLERQLLAHERAQQGKP